MGGKTSATSDQNGTERRLRRDATGRIRERLTSKGVTFGFRFALPDRDEHGKPRRAYETLGHSWKGCDRREAERRAEQILARVRLGQYRTREERLADEAHRSERAEVPTFGAFAAEWFERRRTLGGRRGTGLSTAAESDLAWRLAHLNGWFGGMRLDEITRQEVESYATAKRSASVRAGGLGATSVNKTLATLEAIITSSRAYSPPRLHALPQALTEPRGWETVYVPTRFIDPTGCEGLSAWSTAWFSEPVISQPQDRTPGRHKADLARMVDAIARVA